MTVIAILFAQTAFAFEFCPRGNWGPSSMGYMGGGWMMILWMILLIVGIVALVRWIAGSRRTMHFGNSALIILAERYAKGEISQEEYEAMKKQLQ